MTLEVKKYTVHENYNNSLTPNSNQYMHNDITVIELKQEVNLTIYTPACMAKTSDGTFAGKNAWLYGEIKLIRVQSCN